MNTTRVRVLITEMTLALVSDFAMAAVLTANSTADDTNAGDGFVTLREAIIAANGDGATDLGQTAAGADTLDRSALNGTIVLQDRLPSITTPIGGEGAGGNPVTISGDNGVERYRLFLVSGGELGGIVFLDTGSLALTDVTISNGSAAPRQAAAAAAATSSRRSVPAVVA